MSVRTILAENTPRRVAIGYAGTANRPHPLVHATAWKQADGAVMIAMVKGGVVEHRNRDRIRVSTDPAADGATDLRWCRVCEEPHLRYVTLSGSTPCRIAAARAHVAYHAARRSGETPKVREARMEAERRSDVEDRMDAIGARKPPTRDQMITRILSTIARDAGVDSRRFATVAAGYGLTVEEATTRVEY